VTLLSTLSSVGSLASDTAGSASGAGSTSKTGAASGARVVVMTLGGPVDHALGLTLEAVVALLTAGQDTALLLKVLKTDGREGRRRVVLGGVVVGLVDRDGGVGDVRLDGLLLDDGLDGLVDVVVDVLAGNGGVDRLGGLVLAGVDLVLELGGLGAQALGYLAVIAVLEAAVLNGAEVVVVLLSKALLVVDGLDRGVVVVLVDLLVNGGGHILVVDPVTRLMSHCRSHLFVDGSVVVS